MSNMADLGEHLRRCEEPVVQTTHRSPFAATAPGPLETYDDGPWEGDAA